MNDKPSATSKSNSCRYNYTDKLQQQDKLPVKKKCHNKSKCHTDDHPDRAQQMQNKMQNKDQ